MERSTDENSEVVLDTLQGEVTCSVCLEIFGGCCVSISSARSASRGSYPQVAGTISAVQSVVLLFKCLTMMWGGFPSPHQINRLKDMYAQGVRRLHSGEQSQSSRMKMNMIKLKNHGRVEL